MRKTVSIIVIFALIVFHLSGCAYLSDTNRRMGAGALAGLIIGGIIAGNGIGAVLGGMWGSAMGVLIGDIYDKQIESREEALRKYKLRDGEEKLFVEALYIFPQTIPPYSTAVAKFQYTVLAPVEKEKIKITEKRILFNEREGVIKQAEREVYRKQGTHLTEFRFKIPEEIPEGNTMLIITISTGKQTQTISSPLKII
jgi:hypothetical protein